MPLSPAGPREPLHTRTITCTGYHRDDGLWDIEGHLRDVKSYGFDNDHRGRVEAGEPVHDMWLRLTLGDNLVVRAVEAVTDSGPYAICPDITVNFERLVGLTIGPGWRREVRQKVGGVHGCTHLVELLGPLATTAYQTVFSARARERARQGGDGLDPRTEQDEARPPLINSCHAFDERGPVVKKYWPQFHRPE